jgi:hypothetical protein
VYTPAAASKADASPSSGASEANGGYRPDVLVVVLDCARAKNFRISGGDLIAPTPVIDALADRGTAFPRAVAPSNWTLPSHTSIFTGRYPSEHGIRSYQNGVSLSTTTAERMRAAGYDTGLLTENIQLVGGYGLERGFDQVSFNGREKALSNLFGVKRGRSSLAYSPTFMRLVNQLPPLIAPLSWTTRMQEVAFKRDVCSEAIVQDFARWIAARPSDRPFYAFLNLLDTHNPYQMVSNNGPLGFLDKTYLYAPRSQMLLAPNLEARVPWDHMVRGYAQSISAADAKLGRLLAVLDRAHRLDRTMVIVTADHGQAFGEMGNVYHGTGATDSVARVPLVVAPPAGMHLPKRVDQWVSLCQIDSWLRAVSGGGLPFDATGRAPAKFVDSALLSDVVYSEGPPVSDANRSMRGRGNGSFWSHRLIAAYLGEEKLVLDTDSGDIQRWEMSTDPDRTPPEQLSGAAARDLRTRVFGPYEAASALAQPKRADPDTSGEHEIDARLSSWGYD